VPTPPASGSSPSSAAPELRRHLLHLVVGAIALHAVMFVLHRAVGVDAWPATRRFLFTVVWTALSVAVVGVFLARIRAARIRARRARARLR
jgi:hypothetical protein